MTRRSNGIRFCLQAVQKQDRTGFGMEPTELILSARRKKEPRYS
jgi:hypothetical protein